MVSGAIFIMPTSSSGKIPALHAGIPPRVLVIDNEPLVRWSLTTGLRLAGFDAVPAADAAEARMLAAQLPSPDAVLLDVSLWDVDPRQMLDEIRRSSPRCQFLILAVAGQEVPLPPWDTVAVVRKPFDLHEVVRLVGAAVPRGSHESRLAG
jgi:DNA-binding response OmpR family regulator